MTKNLLIFVIGVFLLFGIGCGSHNEHASHYAGEENREIKSLSAEDTINLLEGNGMGFAKLAELNGYPGPKHILEAKGKLGLTAEQEKGVDESFNEMKKNAVALGKEIVAKEKRLDDLFEENKIDAASLKDATAEISKLKGDLRNVHLRAHLEMKKLLSTDQVTKYKELRGYAN